MEKKKNPIGFEALWRQSSVPTSNNNFSKKLSSDNFIQKQTKIFIDSE